MTFQSPLAWPSKASVVCRWASGEAFANAFAAKPVFRKTAETLPRQFLERLDIVNSNPDCAYRLESAVLLSSMLSEAERLGDVDIASNCCRRSPRRRNFGSGVTGADKPRESRGNRFRSSFDIFNAESKFGSVADYERYTRPYDKRVFEALTDTKLTILHLHYLERPYLGQFKDFNAPVIQYSVKTSGIPISEVRKQYSQPIAGVDEINYEKLTTTEMRKQWRKARAKAGTRYIAAPGCSVPNNSTPEELARFPRSLGA